MLLVSCYKFSYLSKYKKFPNNIKSKSICLKKKVIGKTSKTFKQIIPSKEIIRPKGIKREFNLIYLGVLLIYKLLGQSSSLLLIENIG
jgi:hypothetical protein